MPTLTAGDVPITLAGETRILRPNLTALSLISRAYGGLGKARMALVEQDFDAAVTIIRHGLNLSYADAEDLPQKVFESGLTSELLVPLIRYVAILGNGGKPLADDELRPRTGVRSVAQTSRKRVKPAPKPSAVLRKHRRRNEAASHLNGA